MIFQKKSRSQKHKYNFSLGGKTLEHTTRYNYPGLAISSLGCFSSAIQELAGTDPQKHP